MGTDLQVEETEEGEATFSKSRSNYAGLPDYWYLEFLPSLAPQVLSPVMMKNRTTPNEWPHMGGVLCAHENTWSPLGALQSPIVHAHTYRAPAPVVVLYAPCPLITTTPTKHAAYPWPKGRHSILLPV